MQPASALLQEYGGLELLNRILRGELPLMPIASKLNFNLTAVSPGEVTFTGHPDESVYNLVDTVHGGYAATLLDAAMACAILTTLTRAQTFTTLEIKIQYLRAITTQTGEVQATGKLLHAGRRVAAAEGKIVDRHGKLLAHGTTTCMILPAASIAKSKDH
ncbi:MAG: PaaI family thioesterase [Betaproteobacteria bacterium]|nr:PaaI family thioesterase [Betaproteobacteria bacterium]